MSDKQPLPQARSRDKFDLTMGSLVGIPGVTHTAPTTIRHAHPMTGDVQTFIVQTYRKRDEAVDDEKQKPADEYVFLEYMDSEGSTRIVIPPPAVRAILRQHDALTNRSRRAGAAAATITRKERGIEPAFLKNRKKR